MCIECYLLLQERILSNATESHEDMSPAYGHLNICFGCGISITSRRTHRVQLDCPQRSMILRWTPAHLVSRLEKVCIACWLAATREFRRSVVRDPNRPDNVIEHSSPTLEVTERPETTLMPVSGIPVPSPMPAPTHHSPHLQQVPRLQTIPKHKIYIPLCSRICLHHLDNNHWDELTANLNDFTGFQMDLYICSILERASQRHLDFNNVTSMDPHLRHYWLGLTVQQFNELLSSIPMLNDQVSNPSLALSILLVKLRTGDSNQRLGTLFQLPRSTLERKMNIVRKCLKAHFVPRHLGMNHINVQDVASRNRIIPEGLFGDSSMAPDVKPAIVICDGTYVYVQSSSNYKYQKQTYSLHKYANLVKPFLITCCDGYILECIGPYEATKNDSSIMSDLFRNENGRRLYIRSGI
ncbi:hypothetical protein evm_013921 [Chilo suppressalis]|nr:hypothetical protein evm_013921 [Chilo suppressalis]